MHHAWSDHVARSLSYIGTRETAFKMANSSLQKGKILTGRWHKIQVWWIRYSSTLELPIYKRNPIVWGRDAGYMKLPPYTNFLTKPGGRRASCIPGFIWPWWISYIVSQVSRRNNKMRNFMLWGLDVSWIESDYKRLTGQRDDTYRERFKQLILQEIVRIMRAHCSLGRREVTNID